MFCITNGKGFQMKFPNGWTASVQWGAGNYCDNRNMSVYDDAATGAEGCANAEVWSWDASGKGDGEPRGWLTPVQVIEFLASVARKD